MYRTRAIVKSSRYCSESLAVFFAKSKKYLERSRHPPVKHIVRFEIPVNSRLWNAASQLVIRLSWLSAGKSDDTSPITRHILDKRTSQLKCLLDEPRLIKRRSKPSVFKTARTAMLLRFFTTALSF